MELSNVLFIPKIKSNILSLRQLDEQRYKMVIEHGKLTIYGQHGHLLAKVKKSQDRMYSLKLNILGNCMLAEDGAITTWFWHERFEHLNFSSLEVASK